MRPGRPSPRAYLLLLSPPRREAGGSGVRIVGGSGTLPSVADDDEAKTQVCADCAAVSPPIATNYTLIGTHGWRLTRARDPGGAILPAWRCPTCWLVFKRGSRVPPPEAAAPSESERAARAARETRDERRRR